MKLILGLVLVSLFVISSQGGLLEIRERLMRGLSALPKCCVKGKMVINLRGQGRFRGNMPGVGRPTFIQASRQSCSTMARLKVNFNPLGNSYSGCQKIPLCGRRMLQVDLFLQKKKNNWIFNIGDSSSNNGWGGDGATQTNDAEVQGKDNSFAAYVSDKCRFPKRPPLHYIFGNALGSKVTRLTLEISNEFVRVRNNKGLNRYICSKCLFALDGKSEREGRVNYDIYVALNRVISGTYRRGYGVCEARLKWKCPNEHCKL